MTVLLVLLGRAFPGRVWLDPHLLSKRTSPRFSGELPKSEVVGLLAELSELTLVLFVPIRLGTAFSIGRFLL
jgi:hypothetical protein